MDPDTPESLIPTALSLLLRSPWAIVPEQAWKRSGSTGPLRVLANAAAATFAERTGLVASAETFVNANTGGEGLVALLVARSMNDWRKGRAEIARRGAETMGTIVGTRITEFPVDDS